jgi:3'(2'), 5'-bisphosphate nucleotidase
MEKAIESCVELAREASKEILSIYNSPFQINAKADGSPITQADLAANELIVATLRNAYPEYAILSEETEDDLHRLGKDHCFIIDPIDGTKGFVARNGEFTVNIALTYKHRVVLGVVAAPALNELYFAAQGLGAFVERVGEIRRISVSTHTGNLRMAASRNHPDQREFELAKAHGVDTFVQSGSSLKGCLVAEGNVDVYYRYGPTSEWDTAAMQCIVENAGGIFRQLDGTEMFYNRKDTRNRIGFCAINRIENLWIG